MFLTNYYSKMINSHFYIYFYYSKIKGLINQRVLELFIEFILALLF